MFKKKPQIKNLSPLKSSERRKLADSIRQDYGLPEPQTEQQAADQDSIEPASHTAETLAQLRNRLLPDSSSSAKFSTTHGPKGAVVDGIVYVGRHPGQAERILWFQIGKEPRLIPTVYTLWHNSDLVPLLYIGEQVVPKLQGGADLFAPGLLEPERGWDVRAKKGSIVAVAGHKTDTVPRWVGKATIDVSDMPEDQKGSAAEGLHWEGDELWSWHVSSAGGEAAPDRVEGWPSYHASLSERAAETDIHSEDEDEDEDHGGASLNDTAHAREQATASLPRGEENQVDVPAEEEYVPTTKEVDDAFIQAFLYSVHAAKKAHPTEPHGFDFPLQPSFLIANMIQPYLRHQTHHFTIRKTSWKNTKKFIKHLDKQVLLKSKDRNGGETVILDIDFADQAIKTFQPYKLPKPKPAEGAGENAAQPNPDADTSLGQTLSLQMVYRLSSRLVPELLPSKTAFYTAQEITSALKIYIEANTDLVIPAKKRYIKLNPFIANNILGSNTTSDDNKVLAVGEIDRGMLNRRILDDDHLCISYHVLLQNDQSMNDAGIKPKPGALPKITLTIERRGGNKVVTAIAGLESFHINANVVRPEIQKKCAGSASVAQLVGGKPGMLEITVQGDQRDVVQREILGKRGVKPEWIEVVDKSKKSKGKK